MYNDLIDLIKVLYNWTKWDILTKGLKLIKLPRLLKVKKFDYGIRN